MTEFVDLLVIGGGVNGAGIARDAAGRGLKTMLVERDDLAQGTSSASTKLIHGGLRYLEYFQFRLVREALAEREVLLAMAPHIVRPLRFILPHEAHLRPAPLISAGLFLYDHLAAFSKGGRRLPPSESLRLPGGPAGVPLKPHLRRGFAYSDCRVDDARLVVLNALDARERGARILTRTRFVAARRVEDAWKAEIEDRESGARREVAARALVNAAGPWVAQVAAEGLAAPTRHGVRLVKGSHVVVPRLYEGEHAYILQNPDRRIVFAIPYEGEFTLIGTTDVPFVGDPAGVAVDEEEIAYLLAAIASHFNRSPGRADIVWSYSGVRPLQADEHASAAATSRDYLLELDAAAGRPPLLSVIGGKITTYRRLAEHALDRLAPHLLATTSAASGWRAWTAGAPLPGGDLPGRDLAAFIAAARVRWPFLPAPLATRLARSYGTRLAAILGAATTLDGLGADLGGGLHVAEVDYLVREEWARTPDDILWRRSKLGLHTGAETRRRLAGHLAREGARP